MVHFVSKNVFDVARYNFSLHQPFFVIFGVILLRENSIKW